MDVPTAVGDLANIVQIEAGNADSYALQCVGGQQSCANDGVVWAWGDNDYGQLGNGTRSSAKGSWLTDPVQVDFPSGTEIVSIGEAKDEAYAIDSTGHAWDWGQDSNGSLCLGKGTRQEDTPTEVPGLSGVQAVQGGQDHVLWLMDNGTVEACGNNSDGQLGDGTTKISSLPVHVSDVSNIVQISAGNVSSAAVDSSGQLYMWGSNEFGRLGIGPGIGAEKVPTPVSLPSPVEEVSAGGSASNNGQTIALLTNGSVYAWGCNSFGQLGDGDGTTDSYVPAQVDVPSGATFTEVVTGGYASYGVDTDGNLWSWGLEGGVEVLSSPQVVDTQVSMVSSTFNNVVDDLQSGEGD